VGTKVTVSLVAQVVQACAECSKLDKWCVSTQVRAMDMHHQAGLWLDVETRLHKWCFSMWLIVCWRSYVGVAKTHVCFDQGDPIGN
jgi:hypothetical protein